MLRKRGDYCNVPADGMRNRGVTARHTMRSLGEWDFRPLMRRLTMPALVIEGAESPVPLEQVRVWARELPNARLLLVPRSGHAYQSVERPDIFFPAVERFLRGDWPDGAERLGR
jgi:pimeloyl-ACP methyl ester carboxylesterase